MTFSPSMASQQVHDMRLHFRCEFQIQEEGSSRPPLDIVIGETHKWVMSKNRGNPKGLSGTWFSRKGEWIPAGQRRTRIEVDSASDSAPNPQRYWALRYEHPDSGRTHGSGFRQWRTDISIIVQDTSVLFSLHTAHYLLPGHFGSEPTPPDPTSPLLIKRLFEKEGLLVYSGSQPLIPKPETVAEEDAEALVERITDPTRGCPIVYISRRFPAGDLPLDPQKLSWTLAGLAAVYVADSSWVDKITEKLLPPDYRCWGGRIRVYLPSANFDRLNDSKRHRYFTPEQVEELGSAAIERIIIQSLSRRVALSSIAPIHNIDDLRLKHSELQLKKLKEDLASAPPAEMVGLLESINGELEQKLLAVEKSNRSLSDQLEWTQLETDELKEELKKRRYAEEMARAQAETDRRVRLALEAREARWKKLSALPETIEESCRFFQGAYPDRLAFTTKGMDSAKRARYPKPRAIWSALWHLANTLYPLIFESVGSNPNLAVEFQRVSAIELTLSEGN